MGSVSAGFGRLTRKQIRPSPGKVPKSQLFVRMKNAVIRKWAKSVEGMQMARKRASGQDRGAWDRHGCLGRNMKKTTHGRGLSKPRGAWHMCAAPHALRVRGRGMVGEELLKQLRHSATATCGTVVAYRTECQEKTNPCFCVARPEVFNLTVGDS